MKFYTLGTSLIALAITFAAPASAEKLEACTRKNVLVEVFTADGSKAGIDALADLRDDPRSIVVTRTSPKKGGSDRLADYVGKQVQWVTPQRPQVVLSGQVGLDLTDEEAIKEVVTDLQKQTGVPVRLQGRTVAVGEHEEEAELLFMALASNKNNRVISEAVEPCAAKGCEASLPEKLHKAKGADRWAVVLQSPATGRVLAAEWIMPSR